MRVLQFSGGKDSIALLLLLRDQLSDITVMWTNAGDPFPETVAQMEKVRSMCPNFVEVKGAQPEVIAGGGYPVDVLPLLNHRQIGARTSQSKPLLQGFLECCTNSLFIPMHQKCVELGATTIIRGQKASDRLKGPLRNGDVVDGIEYLFPLEDWTDEQVMAFVKDSDLLPGHYSEGGTGLDCMHCTAYLADNGWKVGYLQRNHPAVGREVLRRLVLINQEVAAETQNLESLIRSGEHGL